MDMFYDNGSILTIEEFADGVELEDFVALKGELDEYEAKQVAYQLINSVKHMH
jgi:serine/threonine protein kinase